MLLENGAFGKQPELKEEGNSIGKRITQKWLKTFLRSDLKLYYITPSLNDILYLHFKGFCRIEQLEKFVNVKVIYFEGNCLEKIENLEKLEKLKSLYLHQNLIR